MKQEHKSILAVLVLAANREDEVDVLESQFLATLTAANGHTVSHPHVKYLPADGLPPALKHLLSGIKPRPMSRGPSRAPCNASTWSPVHHNTTARPSGLLHGNRSRPSAARSQRPAMPRLRPTVRLGNRADRSLVPYGVSRPRDAP